MSWSTYGKKNSTTSRQEAATTDSEPSAKDLFASFAIEDVDPEHMPINDDFPEGYNWHDALRDKASNSVATERDIRESINKQFGFTTDLLADHFKGDDAAVRDYFQELFLDVTERGGAVYRDEFGHLPEHYYRFTKNDLAQIASTIIENGWHKKEQAKPTAAEPEMVMCDCGHEVPRSQRMMASLGSSCPDCYDEMSD